ncbi:MAG: helix-turn-helix transcriptional regulator [Alphaproteobacteria bacterium]|nr:helix-turn-helix transcriptional regulator [Alphaproteobacteria bacterium]
MKVILVDAKYFGQFLKSTRKTLRLKVTDYAKMFGMTRRQIFKIENGKMLVPEGVLEKIITNGIAMILCKRRK